MRSEVTISQGIGEPNMWNLAERMVRAFLDVTVGTVIVLAHVALAHRRSDARVGLASRRPDPGLRWHWQHTGTGRTT